MHILGREDFPLLLLITSLVSWLWGSQLLLVPLRLESRAAAPRLADYRYNRTMTAYNAWAWFGYRANPYSETTLAADETGHLLLAGREKEVERISKRLGSDGNFPALEGPVGAGKTSLLNVTSYRMAKHFTELKQGRLFIPAASPLQARINSDDFESSLYEVILQTLLKWQDDIEGVGLGRPNLALLDKWVNSAEYTGHQASAGVAGFSGGYGSSSEPNTSAGFERHGFQKQIRKILDEVFPAGAGGIICILDNLEILETTGDARRALEELRDRVFGIPQIRWVLCGSRGIVSRARSERLSGIFQMPIVLDKLPDDAAVEAVRRRLDLFSEEGAVAPVTPDGFAFIYSVLNRNMRDALAAAQEFSHELWDKYDQRRDLPNQAGREEQLKEWLLDRGRSALDGAKAIQPRVWQFFEKICRTGGRAGSSEFDSFLFNNQQQFTSAVTSLVGANLMVREVDPDDGTRTINAVTSTGWLVFHARKCDG